MAERVTITVESRPEHGDVLTVQDAMRQVLDFIEVVVAAASDDVRAKIGWRLVSATTKSPFTAVAEAFSIDADWPVIDQYAREAKSRVDTAFRVVSDTGELPDWLDDLGRDRFERIFERNLNGVGRTSCSLDDGATPIVIVERRARQTLEKMQQVEAQRSAAVPDLSGEELGSLDGYVLDATTHRGRPAFHIRDRLTDQRIICVIPADIAEIIGKQHDWRDIWGRERVRVSGKINRNVAGEITIITANTVTEIKPAAFTINEAADPNITGGKGVREYLDEAWDGTVGEN